MIKLSQFLSAPIITHWQAIKRIFTYLKGTIDYELHIKPSQTLDIVGFSDVDWAIDLEGRKSIAGYCVYHDETLIA